MPDVESNKRTIAYRPVAAEDLGFLWTLYRTSMRTLTEELLPWNEAPQKEVIRNALAQKNTKIIVVDGADTGWLHVSKKSGAYYLGHLYIHAAEQNCGIGTIIMRQLLDQAKRDDVTISLDVMKNNRARQFYERLGFKAVGTSDYKIEMRWQAEI